VAHAMALLTRPRPRDRFLNIACGSGTLLIERLACMRAEQVIGCDVSSTALDCARANIAASRRQNNIDLYQADGQMLPLPDRTMDALCADLPFGHRIGSHEENVRLYPLILDEAARVARPGARFVLITHEVRLLEQHLGMGVDERRATPGAPSHPHWICEQVLRVELGGLRPRIFVLRRA
jgi:tRNA (guanine6-N2)-methyltransferase